MFIKMSVQEQLQQQRNDRLRVLVVGAGIAGLTLLHVLSTQGAPVSYDTTLKVLQ